MSGDLLESVDIKHRSGVYSFFHQAEWKVLFALHQTAGTDSVPMPTQQTVHMKRHSLNSSMLYGGC